MLFEACCGLKHALPSVPAAPGDDRRAVSTGCSPSQRVVRIATCGEQGGGGAGKYVLSYTRQDDEAVRLFCKYLPRLRQAFTPVEDAPDRAGTP